MRINMAGWDRCFRFLIGVAMAAWGIAGGPLWAYVGMGLIATAAWRFCPVYAVFRSDAPEDRARDRT